MSSSRDVVRRSVYLDREVDEALRHAAKVNRRSVTSQLDFILRAVLLTPEGTTSTHVYHSFSNTTNQGAFRGPDPKVKPPQKARKLRSVK